MTLTPPNAWSLFRVHGLDPTSLVVWPTVATPLTGSGVDDVVVGVDEDANLLWAVEVACAGAELAAPPVDPPTPPTGEVWAPRSYATAYRPSTALPPFWHPYVIRDVRLAAVRQGRLRISNRDRPSDARPSARSSPTRRAGPTGPVHQIEPAAVPHGAAPRTPVRAGPATDGQPVLWMQRRRMPLLGPPVSNLRFDVLEQALEPT